MWRKVTLTAVAGTCDLRVAPRLLRVNARLLFPSPALPLMRLHLPPPKLAESFATARRQDAQRLPVLGDRAAGDIDLFVAQDVGDGLVGEWSNLALARYKSTN